MINAFQDLLSVVTNELTCQVPILLCSAPGFDATIYVDRIVKDRKLTSIALGSAEGFLLAEKAIASASKTGTWVLLKNVHLSPSWLQSLEKTKLHNLQAHPDFRLFMSMEIIPQ
eukprot:Awhi_evm1s8387